MSKTNLKPIVRKNGVTGEMVAGFLDTTTGVFNAETEIQSDKDMDDFMEKHDITVLLISKC